MKLTLDWSRAAGLLASARAPGRRKFTSRLSLVLVGAAVLVTVSAGSSAAAGETLASRLDSYLRSRGSKSDFSGVVAVEHRGTLLLSAGYGKADYELGVPNDPGMIYRIGSLSKPFTAEAILRLQEESKLNLDDSLCKYLATCPAAWAGVTVRDLLSHTSGIPDLFGDVRAGPTRRMRELIDEVLRAHLESTLVAKPGSAYAYNNFGYLLLAYVVEVAAKEPWEQVLRTRLFEPAGMKDTGYDDVFAVLPGRAHGYEREAGQLRNIEYDDHGAFAAGGLRSTVPDLLAWQRALSSGRLLASDSIEAMFAPVLDHYALGWQSIELLGKRVVNHSGGIDGFSSHLVHYRDDDLTIVVLSNLGDEPAKVTACDLARIVFGLPETVLDRDLEAVDIRMEALDRLVGTYSDGQVVRRIERRGSALAYLREANEQELVALASDRFVLARTTTLNFDADRGSFTMTDGCGAVVATMKRIP